MGLTDFSNIKDRHMNKFHQPVPITRIREGFQTRQKEKLGKIYAGWFCIWKIPFDAKWQEFLSFYNPKCHSVSWSGCWSQEKLFFWQEEIFLSQEISKVYEFLWQKYKLSTSQEVYLISIVQWIFFPVTLGVLCSSFDRKFISCHRKFISCHRKFISCQKKVIACHRNEKEHLVSCDRKKISCDRK